MKKPVQRLLAVGKAHLVHGLALFGLIMSLHMMTAASDESLTVRLVHLLFEVCLAIVFLSEAIVIGGFTTILLLVCTVIGGIVMLVALADYPRRSLNIVMSSGWKKVAFGILLSIIFTVYYEIPWLRSLWIIIAVTCTSSFMIGATHAIRLIIVRGLILPGTLPKFAQKFAMSEMVRLIEQQRRVLHGNRRWKIMNLTAEDGANINAAQFLNHVQCTLEPCQQKWIIIFLGNAGFFEVLRDETEHLASELSANIMMFNFRGIGLSYPPPTKQEDLIMDGRTVMQYLLATGVHPHNVMLYGHSLGGCVAAYLRAEYPGGPLVHDRSFLSLDKVVLGWARNTPSAVRWIIKTLLPPVMHALGWEMDVRKIWGKVKSKAIVLFHKKDEIINFTNSSLEQYLDTIPEDEKNCTIRIELTGGPSSPHNEWVAHNHKEWPTVKLLMAQMLLTSQQ